MRPLICPQCGGQITDYAPGATFARCGYCSTRFVIEENKLPPRQVDPPNLEMPPDPTTPYVTILGSVMAAIVFVSFISLVAVKSKKPATYSTSLPYVGRTSPTITPTPAPTPDPAILRFTVDGASSVAVDKEGRIYVADTKMHVQQFDAQGQFIKVLDVPAKGRNYDRAHYVDKIAVGSDERLYIAVGGVVLIYTQNWAATPRTIQVAPDYIEDFVLRPDGSMLAVSAGDEIETLLFVNKVGAIARRVEGFHTDALNATVSPLRTGAELVRIAVDSQGNIFSAYAIGMHGTFSLSYNDPDLRIARFTPAAKFVKAFAPAEKFGAMTFDQNDRLLIATSDKVTAYDHDGNYLGSFTGQNFDAFTVDREGYIYEVSKNTVAKFPPIP